MSTPFRPFPKPVKEDKKKSFNSIKAKAPEDAELWKVFSLYIRLRDADDKGMCSCFTCDMRFHYLYMQCGHGISRSNNSTKYHEKNNHAQCVDCNQYNGGRPDFYELEVDRRYGDGTWNELLRLSKLPTKKLADHEMKEMIGFYNSKIVEHHKRILNATNK